MEEARAQQGQEEATEGHTFENELKTMIDQSAMKVDECKQTSLIKKLLKHNFY